MERTPSAEWVSPSDARNAAPAAAEHRVDQPLAAPYADRHAAGLALGAAIEHEFGRLDGVVLAVPRSGVPVGLGVARALDLPLDVLVVRMLRVPGAAVGAIAAGGYEVLSEPGGCWDTFSPFEIAAAADRESAEMSRREHRYHDEFPPLAVQGRAAILVDDGLAGACQMRAAIAAVRELSPSRIIVAAPVGQAGVCAELLAGAAAVVCPIRPAQIESVADWYQSCPEVTDADVCACLAAAGRARSGALDA